jgi:protein SMG9
MFRYVDVLDVRRGLFVEIVVYFKPILSSSVLERSINSERKHTNNDFKYYENFIELQSIELVCFILTVCDVVLVAEDWFTDPNLHRVIQTAEMLMPNMHMPGAQDEYIEHYPHMGMIF